MATLVSGPTGLVHIIACIIALITGLLVLVLAKGTRQHKQVGCVYVVAMVILNVTAFMIFRLYGKFGLFHWMSVLSCATLFAGMYPVIVKKSKNYLLLHFNFMYWSVIGLYSALMAETFTRLPKIILTETGEPMTIFYKMVGVATGATMLISIIFFLKLRPRWTKQ